MKILTIERKWFTEMVQQMYTEISKKNYRFLMKNKADKDNFRHFKEGVIQLKENKINLINYFDMRPFEKDQKYEYDDIETNFLNLIRLFDLNEKNDCLTFSIDYSEISLITFFFKGFSANDKLFESVCRSDNIKLGLKKTLKVNISGIFLTGTSRINTIPYLNSSSRH